LHDVAEFRNREFSALQDGKHTHAYSVRKNIELINDGGIHPLNRMKE
jgi:hypothetical protein